MTHYAYATESHALMATWATAKGRTSVTVATAPENITGDEILDLARYLEHLSQTAWRTYIRPASASASQQANSEGWRRRQERSSFREALKGITHPNLPDGGHLLVSYSPIIESGHRIGRALHSIADAQLSASVLAEAETELASVEQAELGNLNGRARQAVLLSREDVSPVQLATADALLHADPFGSTALLTDVDPTAAAVATAHWLQAAADITAAVCGIDPTDVVVEADNIEALPHETPTRVLELIDEGSSPHDVVVALVRDALAVADGLIPDQSRLFDQMDQVEDLVERHASTDDVLAEELRRIRLTPLDPQRPAPDLLEDLLEGIRACWLLFEEYAEYPDTQDGEWDQDIWEEWHAGERNRFIDRVRTEAVRAHERLL
ncbi:hypothetical protein R6V09_12850 [Streptomyces sp. W16]|uniref:hypothetical protein n=1 Tax=Streptomyces sp. W16 TaxID=3076631 RepID=UPI00295BF120|nr:hypothetical protein [Streptomyces sp. W16]MDV9171020.1 hypothetical protein [Streptomyces sp. W16]